MENDKTKKREDKHTDANKPEPETLHTPDPQEEMEGPVSSLVNKAGGTMKEEKTKEQADKERDEHM